MSTAFHPQTDGLSERKNQWVEQFLRFVTSAQQDDWSDWLPVATAVHNSWVNSTTGTTPIQALLGYLPRLNPDDTPLSSNQRVEDRGQQMMERRQQAREALNRTAQTTPERQYDVGAQVWLEAKNLALPYQTPKLAPKRHGPFKVIKQVSPVVSRYAFCQALTPELEHDGGPCDRSCWVNHFELIALVYCMSLIYVLL